MRHLCAYNVRSEYFTIWEATMDEIIEGINRYHFNSILYDPKLEIDEGILEFTDYRRPISIGHDYVFKNYLAINGKYYDENKREINKALLTVCKLVETQYLHISKELTNTYIRTALINNKKIKTLIIGNETIR